MARIRVATFQLKVIDDPPNSIANLSAYLVDNAIPHVRHREGDEYTFYFRRWSWTVQAVECNR